MVSGFPATYYRVKLLPVLLCAFPIFLVAEIVHFTEAVQNFAVLKFYLLVATIYQDTITLEVSSQ